MKKGKMLLIGAIAAASGGFAQGASAEEAIKGVPGAGMASKVAKASEKYLATYAESLSRHIELVETPEDLEQLVSAVYHESSVRIAEMAASCQDTFSSPELRDLAQRCIQQEVRSVDVIEETLAVSFTQQEVDAFREYYAGLGKQKLAMDEAYLQSMTQAAQTGDFSNRDELLQEYPNVGLSGARVVALSLQLARGNIADNAVDDAPEESPGYQM